ncbi:MAG TPA: PASTA domain-containing protein [Kribbella sp.]
MRLAFCGVVLLAAGCGGAGPVAQPTVTVTEVPPSLSASVGPGTLPSLPPSSVTAGTTVRPPQATPAPRVGVVPNVVGVNHQLAQDTMQAAGFYYLTEEDASGKGRLLVNDRNWVVVSQIPAGGTTTSLDTKITLRSKKIGE